jgi:hypothetical protein
MRVLFHAAALAIAGWYLIVPPSTRKSFPKAVDMTQPLCEWEKIGQFDGADDCQRALKRLAYEGQKPGEMPATTPEADSGNLVKGWRAQCIASDDPRLNRK